MLTTAKKLALPATFAVAGVQAAAFIGAKNPWMQIAIAIVGAGLGLAAANAIAK